MAEDVKKWLEGFDLGKYAEVFAENEIDFVALPRLTEDDLKDLGLPIGARRKLQAAIETLSEQESQPKPAGQRESTKTTADAERRQLTVMFCDLVGSTELSQQLDPEDLREVNRAYQDACKAAIERYDGYVARYMGDGVLAYFGYPQAHEDDTERAIHAGLGVVASIAGLSNDTQSMELGVRVGIATGPVVVGDLVGEGASQENAVVGETPNLAARLQGLAAENTIVISPGTYDLAGERFEYKDLGQHELKGIAETVQAWQVIAPAVAESRFEVRQRTGLTPLVGREHEIGLLLDRWSQAKEQDGQVVLLSGEAGIGKSRITETLRERTADDDPVRLRYQCSPFYANTALHPIGEQLQRAARIEADDPNELKLDKLESFLGRGPTEPEEVVPLLAPLLSISTGGRYAALDMTPEQQKEQTLEALLGQMEGLSRQKPVLLIFEDIHWADPTSLELLELTIDRAQRIPVLVVLTYRPEFSPPWGDYTHVTSLTLNRFTRNLASSMVAGVTGGKPLPDEVREQIIERTDGVPLFVEELTKTILESGVLAEESDRYVTHGSLGEVAIPATLHDSLMARLDRLGAVKEVAQTASVIGREFEYELLAAVSEISFEQLRDSLNQLVDAGLIFRRGLAEDGQYIFKHALVQDAAYRSLLKSKRRKLHQRIAEVLKSRFSERVESEPELLAHHFTEAGLIEPAFEQWKLAGLRAVDAFANVEATSHLSKALELFAKFDDSDQRAREELSLQTSLAAASYATTAGPQPITRDALFRARELCRQIGDSSQLHPVLYGLFNHYATGGQMPEALTVSDEFLELALEDGDRVSRLVAHSALGSVLMFMGRLEPARDQHEHAIALHVPEEDFALSKIYGEHPAMFSMIFRGLILGFMGFLDQALEQCDEAVKATQHGSDTVSTAGALFFSSWVRLLRGDSAQASDLAQATIDYSNENPPGFLGWGLIMKGWTMVDLECGAEKGLRLMARELAEERVTHSGFMFPFLGSLLAQGHARCNDRDEALKLVNRCLDEAHRSRQQLWEAELHRLQGEILLSRSPQNLPDAQGCFEEAINVAREQGAKTLELRAAMSLAQLWRDQDNPGDARGLLSPIYDWFTEGFDTPDLKEAKTLLDQLS